MKKNRILAYVLVLAMAVGQLVGCSGNKETDTVETMTDAQTQGAVSADTETKKAEETEGEAETEKALSGIMTVAGTPREETLIIEGAGIVNNPTQNNPYMSGTSAYTGVRQLMLGELWGMNVKKNEQFEYLAKWPVPLNDDYTSFEIHLTEGIKWNDGEDFNADDVVFTINALLEHQEEITQGRSIANIIESCEKVDDYTLVINTTSSRIRLTEYLGIMASRGSYPILPEHYWKDHDLVNDPWETPIGVGPYSFTSCDPNGYWFLYTLRDDAEYSDVAVLTGDIPEAKYVLIMAYSSNEVRMMSLVNNELDVSVNSLGLEESVSLIDSYDQMQGYSAASPYGTSDFGAALFGVAFNCMVEPFDQIQVRRAMALAIDITDVAIAANQGNLYVHALTVPSAREMVKEYYEARIDELASLTWEDGYQPFDTGMARRLYEELQSKGYQVEAGLTEEQLAKRYGVGWWKYDPQKAEELLIASGLERDADGMWTYGGKRISFEILTYNGNAYAISAATSCAEQWREFGFDCNPQLAEIVVFNGNRSNGDFTAVFEAGAWSFTIKDLYTRLANVKSTNAKPIGEASSNDFRYQSERYDELLKQLGQTPSGQEAYDLDFEAVMVLADEMAWIPMFSQPLYPVYNNTYFTGYATEEQDTKFLYSNCASTDVRFAIAEYKRVR